ncbi:hypothetical protein BT67DRAFT_446163 [Trichocladium antarcticum]|uniref:GYF domain-containing protein n=1 Tax=Trichocladium antarcticum TaxID=1450529 RepID=A0AAN6UBJ4_9PEZI|nr:hypothetical protein BT67DRAFT_446163 [Trichocladium antarcticum]
MSQLTSSFASAAAGQNRDPRGSGRSDAVRGSGSGEWPRSNGTRTFRRASTTPFNQPATASPADMSQTSVTDLPSMSAHNPALFDHPAIVRYSREELLEIYRIQVESSQTDPSDVLMPNWNPAHQNGGHSRPWGKSTDSPHVPQDPSVCWDSNGGVKPVNFEPMSAEEEEMFATDVNSTLKPPQLTKDGNHPGVGGVNGRKASISLGSATNYPISSPSTASRPGTRRRETADITPFPVGSTASPTANRLAREESWFPRRSTDLKESISDEPEEDPNTRDPPARSQPFGLTRNHTTGAPGAPGTPGTPGLANQSSFWGSGAAATATATAAVGGLGTFGSFALPTPSVPDKRFATGGSRLAHLIPKDSADNASPKPSDAPSWRPRPRTDTDPFGGDDGPSGSAILGGGHDTSPTSSMAQGQRAGGFDTPVKGSAGDFGMAGLNLGHHGHGNGPASPSETNPYRSPMADRVGDGQDEHDTERQIQSGPGSDQQSNFGTLPRSFGTVAFDGSDRSQTSSVGAKGFGAAAHTFSGWPTVPAVSTPDRERAAFQNAFGGNIFSPLADLPSPGLGGLGGVFGASGTSRLGRGKLESLFPPAMQAQMHGHDQDNLGDSVPDLRQANPLGAIGRGAIGMQPRDTGSPVRSGRVGFDDILPASESSRSPFSTAEQGQAGLTSMVLPQSFPTGGAAFPSSQPTGDPTAVRTMVMPDRMRWVYLDPQGTMQGPFSGLEMNDWYKANFFTPDLRVKRLEDPDFEPLGQLIRRIGNSREPFLVPQMGIAHGPPPIPGPFGATSADAVPPLQSAFPSFGRTLTAQQQNDLERRKQEEQMFHARQRELVHHHPAFGRLPPIQPGGPGGLHHHSSAHSLQSQPSFGSITSPIGMGPQHPLGPIAPGAGFFDSATPMTQGPAQPPIGAPPDLFAPDLNFSERQVLANLQGTSGLTGAFPSSQAVGGPAGDSSGLHSQLPSVDQLQKDSQGFSARLKEFNELRAQFDAEETTVTAGAKATSHSEAMENAAARGEDQFAAAPEGASAAKENTVSNPAPAVAKKNAQAQAELSLTEKVRKTQADKANSSQPAPASDLPKPFPPPLQTTAIAAPTAQRPASNLPAQYGDRSESGTPDTASDGAPLAPPPTAPWAVQPGTGVQKGPSLREIQEAETKKAAKKEEAAAAARKAALEQEAAALRERERAAVAALTSGLPTTSTWGTGSPVSAPGGSPWKQPAAVKTGAVVTGAVSSVSKKTLADIQREEEVRKQKAAAAAAAAAVVQISTPPASSMGKRYADLASKTSAPPGSMAAVAAPQIGGWSTVGAGGKVKIPTGPAVQSRSSSVSNLKATPAPAVVKAAPKPVSASVKDGKNAAMDEFKKWLHRELGRGLIGVSDIEHFGGMLLEMPLDSSILAEAVYGYSTTMDGRHFGEEFVRRKKLADKGVVEPVGAPSASGNGGWNEVAKKGSGSASAGLGGNGNGGASLKEEAPGPGFRVVASKKTKGKK